MNKAIVKTIYYGFAYVEYMLIMLIMLMFGWKPYSIRVYH